jgi:hypothetical protein
MFQENDEENQQEFVLARNQQIIEKVLNQMKSCVNPSTAIKKVKNTLMR